jgi:ubiquitin carboxyl-terminal hydrolase 34
MFPTLISFFDYFARRPEALRNLLMRNPDGVVRNEMGRSLIFVLGRIKASHPQEYGLAVDSEDEESLVALDPTVTVMALAAELFSTLWESFQTSIRAWPEYFGTMVDFVQLGQDEAAACLDKDFLAKVLLIVSADPAFNLPPQYTRMLTAISRRMATRPPNYDNIIALIDVLLEAMDPKIDRDRYIEGAAGRYPIAAQDDTIPFTANEVNILHKEWDRNGRNVFVEKLILLNQNPVATDNIIRRLMGLHPRMDQSVCTTLKANITGQLVTYMVTPFIRAAVIYCHASSDTDSVRRLVAHIGNQCRGLQNAEGRSFFEFFRDTHGGMRGVNDDDDDDDEIETFQMDTLQNLHQWVPGLLGCMDHSVSNDVENFLKEKLFRHDPQPTPSGGNANLDVTHGVSTAAKKLGISCLQYLYENYVSRRTQAARDTVVPLNKVIVECGRYVNNDEITSDQLDRQYVHMAQAVMEPMTRLTVDEIEEDGSGTWSDSSTATLEYE